MALNIAVGSIVCADFDYILNPANRVPSQTVQHLLTLGSGNASIREIGYIKVENRVTSRPLPIRVLPADAENALFQHGQGTLLNFTSEDQINGSLRRV